MIVVIDFLDLNTSGYLAHAIGTCNCADFVLAGLDQLFDDIFANPPANLFGVLA